MLLENTAGLRSKRHNQDFNWMLTALRQALPGFEWHWRVLDSAAFGVPQQRKRLYIIGLKTAALSESFSWDFVTDVAETGTIASRTSWARAMICRRHNRRGLSLRTSWHLED